ncbi:MAG TPA: M42 family peptidase [Candidatus Limnocylindria bacterium]|nr:M42 family peptidase [Candidatus Limnocylindria bacterium]
MELRRLVEAFGPSGCEGEVRGLLREEARKYCEDVRVDRMGNLICRKPARDPEKPRVVVTAHMDEVGFIVTGYAEDGLLRFKPVGGVDPRVVVSKWLRLGDERIPGIVGAMAIHLQTAADREKVLEYDQLFIDVGAKDKAEAERLCPLGTYAVFDTPYMEMGDGFVSAKALDDRVGCHSLLEVLRHGDYAGELVCAFVTQEETGLRGSRAAAYTLQPDIAIALEGTAANDLGDVKPAHQVCVPGEGVAVSFMDHASIADRGLFDALLRVAREAGIPCQVKRGMTGGNDAGSFRLGGAGSRTCVLSVPCRYIHSGVSMAKLTDVKAQADLVKAWLLTL